MGIIASVHTLCRQANIVTGNGRIAGILVVMQAQGLGTEYVNERNDKVNAVTLTDIQRVVKRVYRPDDLRFVVVGRQTGVEPVN